MFGLPPDHYDKWPRLRKQFNLVSTSKDRWAGKEEEEAGKDENDRKASGWCSRHQAPGAERMGVEFWNNRSAGTFLALSFISVCVVALCCASHSVLLYAEMGWSMCHRPSTSTTHSLPHRWARKRVTLWH
jgi:hypothetical protein